MKEVTVQEVKQMQDEGVDFQFIDVREDYEYKEDNLGAEWIPLGSLIDNADDISKEKQVVIHCRSGARSGQACLILEMNLGYTNVYNMKGGILAYREQIK